MTREEILAMPAGRELDRMVMEKVFNAKKGYYGEEEVWYHYDNNGEPDYEWSCYISPSTDISAAWEVVEKIREKDLFLNIYMNTFGCICYVSTSIGLDLQKVKCDTATEAICKAALIAVMEGKSHDL